MSIFSRGGGEKKKTGNERERRRRKEGRTERRVKAKVILIVAMYLLKILFCN